MKDNCLDIGIIQAFLDGEMAHGETARVSGHIATCPACAVMLSQAEDESAIVFPALEREFNTLVPTQRLWSKINDSIETERESRPFWQKAWAFLAVALGNPSIAVAATVLLMIGVVAMGLLYRVGDHPPTYDLVVPVNSTSTAAVSGPSVSNPIDVNVEPKEAQTIRYENASYHPDSRRVIASPINSPAANSSSFMPGEESYVKTIASLNKTVDDQKDGVLRPGERISYERDMAVVDDAITKMRKEVKRNPKNESAKQVLYSSYQNKIDLLNSVAQKEELVASLR